jgi:hypothetical protein
MRVNVTQDFLRQVLDLQGLTLPAGDLEALTPGVANLLTMFETFDELELDRASPDVITIFPD